MVRRVGIVKCSKPFLLLIALIALVEISPIRPQAWMYEQDNLTPVFISDKLQHPPIITQADLNQDQRPEYVNIQAGHLAICRKPDCLKNNLEDDIILWKTPLTWRVIQAGFTDLNRDNKPEITLLVWRPFAPWPIDRYLPNKGRIMSFQDVSGQSCHLILIGWQRGKFKELWAGSALVNPIHTFAPADLNKDGFQELVILESKYNDLSMTPAWGLSIWEWNGFGFSRLAGIKGRFDRISVFMGQQDHLYLINQ